MTKRRCTSPRLQPTPAEWDLIRSRLIALECVVTALMSDASQAQVQQVRSLVSHLSHHEGSAPHPLTARALKQIDHLLLDVHRSPSSGHAEQGLLFSIPA